jgi:hypothetical protein
VRIIIATRGNSRRSAVIRAINAIQTAGAPLCTLNCDSLLEQLTGLPTVHLAESIQVNEWMLRHKPIGYDCSHYE